MNRTLRPVLWLAAALALGCDQRERTPLPLGPAVSNLDRTRPAVISTLPSQGATQVGLTTPIAITFSEPVRRASINRSTIVFDPPIDGPVTLSGNTATIVPLAPLAANTIYRGTVTTDVEDMAHNDLEAPFVWTFTTGVPTPFVVAGYRSIEFTAR